MPDAPIPGPLADVTILDLSDESTVFAAKLLADLGADIIRVESVQGDAVRGRAPFLDSRPGIERSLAHLAHNAGKRSVALDLTTGPAWDVIKSTAASVDVVIAPLDKDQLTQAFFEWLRSHQHSVGVSVVDIVFRRGAEHEVATDLIATAAGGLLTLNGFPEDPPNHPAGQLAYKQASLTAAEAALALTMQARRTGEAGWVTVSLQEAVNFTTIQTANANLLHWQGHIPSRHTPLSAFTIFRSRDGHWTSFVIHPPKWDQFVDWANTTLGAEQFQEPEWRELTYRGEKREEIGAVIGELCAALDREELLRHGQALGLLVLPVNSLAQIAADAHLIDREFFSTVDHPQLDTSLTMPRTPFRSSAHAADTRPAPSLGQHTEDILRTAANISSQDIESLFVSHVAAGPRLPSSSTPHLSVPKPAPSISPTAPRQPLQGVRILDFGWAIAGPLSTRLLADLGADVIKVESEYRTDPIRYIGVQPPDYTSLHTNGQFNDCNTNKRALTLNLNTPQGIELIKQLAAKADVVISNYTPDRLDRWGLSYDALRALQPTIIVANLAVMGVSGPHKDWRSYGNGIVAMCGLGDRTGFPGRVPIGLGTLHTDFTVPYFAAIQVMAALIERERTGAGQHLELSQYEASTHLLDTDLVQQMNGGALPERNGNRSAHLAPHGVYPASGDDQWVAVACRNDDDWTRLQAVTGLDGLRDISDRRAQEDEVEQLLSAWTSSRDAWEAAHLLQESGVPASPVENLHDLLNRDKAMNADYREVEVWDGITALVQEQPILWDGERLPIKRAPRWSEHTEEILRDELGIHETGIADLAAANVLF